VKNTFICGVQRPLQNGKGVRSVKEKHEEGKLTTRGDGRSIKARRGLV